MNKYMLMAIMFCAGLLLTIVLVSLAPCQEVEGPVRDVIAERIESRIAAMEAAASLEREGFRSFFETSRREDRRLWQSQHAEELAMQGRIRDIINNRLSTESLSGIFNKSLEAREGRISEALKSLKEVVVTLIWLVGAVAVLSFVALLWLVFFKFKQLGM